MLRRSNNPSPRQVKAGRRGIGGCMPKALGDMAWWVLQSNGHAKRTQLRLSARHATISLLRDPKSTALIICDTRENHWCRNALARGMSLLSRRPVGHERGRRLSIPLRP